MSLDGFVQHGVVWVSESGTQKVGTCPKCGKDKLYVNVNNLLWDCKVCSDNGNWDQFLAWRLEQYRVLDGRYLVSLAAHRGLNVSTLRAWGVGYDPLAKCYLIPDFYGAGLLSVCDLHRYWPQEKKRLSTKGGKHGFMHVSEGWAGLDAAEVVWLCEGEWDSMAVWEALSSEGRGRDMVVGVSGCSSLPQKLMMGLAGKDVRIVFDSDKAGRSGTERASAMLAGVAKEVHPIAWPASVVAGYDVRDLFMGKKGDHAGFLRELRGLCGVSAVRKKTVEVAPEKAAGELVKKGWIEKEYKKWLAMGSTEVLDVLFGTIFANRMRGDPLWVFLVGPPGDGKTELLMSLSGSDDVHTVTTLSPHSLISGSNMGGTDPSLIPKLNGKVLVIKDFTTIMNMNRVNLDEMMGVLRDAYDGKIDKEFGNGVTRRYNSRFGIIAGVTPAVETLTQTGGVLGERFLKYRTRTPGKIDVGSEAALKAIDNIDKEVGMREDLEKVAKKVAEGIPKVTHPLPLTDAMKIRIMKLAQWVSLMRAVVARERYTNLLQFRPSPERATRLAKQLCKLAMGVAMFRGEKTVEEDTFMTVARVARDTAPDRAEELIKQMYLKGEKGSSDYWAKLTRFPQGTVSHLLQDFDLLNVVVREDREWGLSPAMVTLMDELGMYADEKVWRKKPMKKGGKAGAAEAVGERRPTEGELEGGRSGRPLDGSGSLL